MLNRIMFNILSRFVRDERGASGIEYAIIAAMVALVLIAFVADDGISGSIKGIFEAIKTSLSGATDE
ncbi:Flp family type IVb pilin [Pseudomonas sp. LRF_L74]|uniref:Flp family type IVb pilin n=1 Tax=Pseudomonas sp. LRF_L74 TaxID=3369422 RepID=UPI003F642EED